MSLIMKKALTLFAREEPTTDDVLRQYAPEAKRLDTVFYEDSACQVPYARIPWHHRGRPRKRRSVVLNCFRWNLQWVSPLAF